MKLTNAKLRCLPIGRKVSDGGGLYYQPTAPNKGKCWFHLQGHDLPLQNETQWRLADNEKCFNAVYLL